MANDANRVEQPVRLPNPTAEGFVQALKIVRFFAVVLFWLVLVVVLAQLAAFVLVEWVGWFDAKPAAAAPAAEMEATEAPAEGAAEEVPEGTATKEASPPEVHLQRRAFAACLLDSTRATGMVTSVLLWVTLFLFLQIVLLGRLGGVKQLTLCVFLMLLFLASALPWSALFEEVGAGAYFHFETLMQVHSEPMTGHNIAIYYLRFLVVTLVSLFLLVVSWVNFARGYEESVLLNE